MDNHNVESDIYRDKCGESMTWRIEQQEGDKNVLIIEGDGDMYDYSDVNYPPWKDLMFSCIVLSPEIVSIGEYAFSGSNITSVEIDVKKIGEGAFSKCPQLVSVILKGTEYIGCNAFENDTGLKYIRFSDDLKIVPQNCCKNCRGLILADIPNGVIHIQRGAFIDCDSLRDIELPYSAEFIEDGAFDLHTQIEYGECDFESMTDLGEDFGDILDELLS
ncbi:MAG: leucine-rich repeat domain-containing protein [Lachnospiraceae bacterium]|nr:leucine-rich repeat domain-containing protein [Lachnospiraceae bacterium]